MSFSPNPKYVSLSDRLEYIDRLRAIGMLIQPMSDFDDCRDKKDNKFLNLAYDVSALYILTGDEDLLILYPFHDIQIVSPANFVNNFLF